MKTILITFLTSFSLTAFANICDLQSFNDEIEQVNIQFDNFEISAEDQHIAVTTIERLKGEKVLSCVLKDTVSNITKHDFILASQALQSAVYEEIASLDRMLEFYETHGNYLMVDKIKDEKSKVYYHQKRLDEKMAKLSEQAPF